MVVSAGGAGLRAAMGLAEAGYNYIYALDTVLIQCIDDIFHFSTTCGLSMSFQ